MRARTFLIALLVVFMPLRALAFMPQLHCAMGQLMEAPAAAPDGCPSHDGGQDTGHDGCGDPARAPGCPGGACCSPAAAAHGPNPMPPLPEARPPWNPRPATAERTHVPPLPERPPSNR